MRPKTFCQMKKTASEFGDMWDSVSETFVLSPSCINDWLMAIVCYNGARTQCHQISQVTIDQENTFCFKHVVITTHSTHMCIVYIQGSHFSGDTKFHVFSRSFPRKCNEIQDQFGFESVQIWQRCKLDFFWKWHLKMWILKNKIYKVQVFLEVLN